MGFFFYIEPTQVSRTVVKKIDLIIAASEMVVGKSRNTKTKSAWAWQHNVVS